MRFDDDVTNHLFSVASGLDSAVLGESEVLGQVRRAWERARAEEVSGPVLGALFRHAVETGKRVRSETAIARGITSLSHGAVALAGRHRTEGLAGARVLVVGAGEMGEGVTQALAGHGTSGVVVANRTVDRAEELVAGLPTAARAGSTAASLEILAGCWPRRCGLHLGGHGPPGHGSPHVEAAAGRPAGRPPCWSSTSVCPATWTPRRAGSTAWRCWTWTSCGPRWPTPCPAPGEVAEANRIVER